MKVWIGDVEQAIELGSPQSVAGALRVPLKAGPLVGVLHLRGSLKQLAVFVPHDAPAALPVTIGPEQTTDPEFSRSVMPGAGIAWESAPWPSWRQDPPSEKWSAWWKQRAAASWDQVDVGWTFTTGSPRNRFFDERERAALDSPLRPITPTQLIGLGPWKGATPDTDAALSRFTRWQLQRRHQHRGVLTYPLALAGGKPKSLPNYVGPGKIGTVTPCDSHHFSVDGLAAAFRLTGNPLALDQLCALMSYAIATEVYFDPAWHWPFGGQPRPAGRILCAIATTLECLALAGPATHPFAERLMDLAADLIGTLTKIGFNEQGKPNLFGQPDGRHLLVEHNLPPYDAIVALGCVRLHEVAAIPGALEHGERLLDYIERDAWSPQDGTFFDSIPHNAADSDVPPKLTGGVGIAQWNAPALIVGGRLNSPLLGALVTIAKAAKVGHEPYWTAKNWQAVSNFGPLLED